MPDGTDWYAVGALAVSAVNVTVMVVISWRQRVSDRKQLGYLVMFQAPVSEGFDSDVVLAYGGTPVPGAHFYLIRVVNSGRQPIRSEDFEQPLRIRFDRTVLAAATMASSPGPLFPALKEADSEVTLEPLLLNPRDWLEIQVLVDGRSQTVAVDARVAGVRRIRDLGLPPGSVRSIVMSGWFVFGLFVAISYVLLSVARTWESRARDGFGSADLAVVVVFVLALLVIPVGAVVDQWGRRRKPVSHPPQPGSPRPGGGP